MEPTLGLYWKAALLNTDPQHVERGASADIGFPQALIIIFVPHEAAPSDAGIASNTMALGAR
jgi:hypothetical protein